MILPSIQNGPAFLLAEIQVAQVAHMEKRKFHMKCWLVGRNGSNDCNGKGCDPYITGLSLFLKNKTKKKKHQRRRPSSPTKSDAAKTKVPKNPLSTGSGCVFFRDSNEIRGDFILSIIENK